ncbi:N-acetylmuramoyl-L-alanine amidase [Georgenia sp. SUBG003]|uniref:N-acetylmuramoyl-L-alanine amidase n=1 Tax=Georgenia sp. SUBG003 TaxID=1497974 RepID=UPI003AB3B610
MSGPNVLATALAAGALVVGTALPAQSGTADGAPRIREPLTVVSLTNSAGARTDVAVAGLEELAEEAGTGGTDGAPSGWTTALAGAGATALGRGAPTVRPASSGTAPELGNIAVLTPPVATDQFLVAGLTWQAGDTLPAGGRVFLRVLEHGSWTEWLEVEEEDGADRGQGGRAGTDPFVTGGAEAVQIQVTGSADDLPAGLDVSLIPAEPDDDAPGTVITEPTDEPAKLPAEEPAASTEPAAFTSAFTSLASPRPDAVAGPVPTASSASLTTPSVTPAAQPAGTVASTPTATSSGTVVPAAVTTPAPGRRQPRRLGCGREPDELGPGVRAPQGDGRAPHRRVELLHMEPVGVGGPGDLHYHSVTRGWGDIGYNYLVDKWGRVFEGRSGSLASPDGQMVVGGHAQPFNSGTLGISAMGNFDPRTATDIPARGSILDSMADVVAWHFARASIDMTSPSGLVSNGTPTRPAGQNLPRIFGHKDVSTTSCPGLFYGDLGQLSASVNARMPQLFHLNNAWGPVADVTFRYGDRGATSSSGTGTATAWTPSPPASETPSTSGTPTPTARRTGSSPTAGSATPCWSGTGTVTGWTPSRCGVARSTTSRTPSAPARRTW